jgi:hypothetical protein
VQELFYQQVHVQIQFQLVWVQLMIM